MQHLLARDLAEQEAPALDRGKFVCGDAFALLPLQRPHRVEIGAHHRVLELRRLAQEVDELFAVLNDDVGGHAIGMPYGRAALQPFR